MAHSEAFPQLRLTMKTVIPAAGLGTRFLPLTKEQQQAILETNALALFPVEP